MSVKKTLDEAIRVIDKYTIAEEDGGWNRYEGGTYVLYVDGKPVADGSLDRMKRLMKEELRYR